MHTENITDNNILERVAKFWQKMEKYFGGLVLVDITCTHAGMQVPKSILSITIYN